MDDPQEERCKYRHVTNIIGSKETDITSPGILSLDRMHQVLNYVRYNIDNLQTNTYKIG